MAWLDICIFYYSDRACLYVSGFPIATFFCSVAEFVYVSLMLFKRVASPRYVTALFGCNLRRSSIIHVMDNKVADSLPSYQYPFGFAFGDIYPYTFASPQNLLNWCVSRLMHQSRSTLSPKSRVITVIMDAKRNRWSHVKEGRQTNTVSHTKLLEVSMKSNISQLVKRWLTYYNRGQITLSAGQNHKN